MKMATEPVFSEQEATKIIQRAVELTEEANSPRYKPGITREELERIASEVGVSADTLAKAISEAGQSQPSKGLFGLTREYERVVDGELDPSQYDIVIEGLRPLANAGQPAVAQVGRTLSMSTWTGVSQAKVDLTSRNGRTRIKVKSNAFFQALLTLHPALMTGLIAAGALGERGLGWLGAAIAAGAIAIGTTLFGFLTKKGHQKAEVLADDLRERIARTVAEQSMVDHQPAEAAQITQRLGQGG
jgi:hypothetical protein